MSGRDCVGGAVSDIDDDVTAVLVTAIASDPALLARLRENGEHDAYRAALCTRLSHHHDWRTCWLASNAVPPDPIEESKPMKKRKRGKR